MDGYRLTLRRKSIVTTYGADGLPTGTTESFIETVQNDLPAQLVNTYKRLFPDSVVSAERVQSESAETGYGTRGKSYADRPSIARRGSPAASKPRDEGIVVGDYAAAVSAAVKREARV